MVPFGTFFVTKTNTRLSSNPAPGPQLPHLPSSWWLFFYWANKPTHFFSWCIFTRGGVGDTRDVGVEIPEHGPTSFVLNRFEDVFAD